MGCVFVRVSVSGVVFVVVAQILMLPVSSTLSPVVLFLCLSPAISVLTCHQHTTNRQPGVVPCAAPRLPHQQLYVHRGLTGACVWRG